jgi:hypothetical protein
MVREVRSAGSLYGFARAALGPFAGFMGGWMILLDYLMIPSLVYVIMAVALGQLMPEVDRAVDRGAAGLYHRSQLVRHPLDQRVQRRQRDRADCGHGGAGDGRRVFLGPTHAFSPAPVWADPLPWQGVLAGTSVCVLSFLGFDAVSTLAEDTADRSGRTLGRAILAVLALATVFFGLSTWVLGNAMVGRHFASLDAAHYELAGAMLGAWARPGWPGSLRWSWALPMPCRCRWAWPACFMPWGATDKCPPCLPGCIRATTRRGWRCWPPRRCRWWSRWCFAMRWISWRPWSISAR